MSLDKCFGPWMLDSVRDRLCVRRLLVTTLAVSLAGASSLGCAGLGRVLGFKEQAEQRRQLARIEGRIDTEGKAEGTLVVVLGSQSDTEDERPKGVDTFVRVRPGTFAFPVAPGRYQVGAYEDRNGNGLLDPGERAVRVADGPILEVGPGEVATYDIVLAKDAVIPEITEPLDIFELIECSQEEQKSFSLWAWTVEGEICEDLDDEAFGPAAGPYGLWEIMDLLNDGLAGIYFMEPFDPDRIPVVFVHGISGYPREFSTLMAGSSSASNDGTVTVSSQARMEAVEQADSRWPLDYGHVDILHAPETVERVNDLLDRRFRRGWSLTAK